MSRASSLQGKNVRIGRCGNSAQLPLLTTCPNRVAERIFCEKFLLGPTRFELKSVCAVAWYRTSAEMFVFELIELPLLAAFPKYYLLWEKTGGLPTLQSHGFLRECAVLATKCNLWHFIHSIFLN